MVFPGEGRGRTVNGPRTAWPALVIALASGAGCLFEPNLRAVRAEYGALIWTGEDLGRVASEGDVWGAEIAVGTDQDPNMGPLYFGLAYSRGALDRPELGAPYDDVIEHRLGGRARSSMLHQTTAVYPYAAVGAYVGWIEDEAPDDGNLGIGVEGGYGARVGLGSHLALDVDMIFAYGYYESGYSATQTRFHAALAAKW
jgi:hypothetical protein